MFEEIGGKNDIKRTAGKVHGLGGSRQKSHVGQQKRGSFGIDVSGKNGAIPPRQMVDKLAMTAGDVENTRVIRNASVKPVAQNVPNGLAPCFAMGKTAAIDIVKRQSIGHQMPPMRICSSIHGMTSSRMASREVVARKPRSRAAFSTLGTRFWTSYRKGSSET